MELRDLRFDHTFDQPLSLINTCLFSTSVYFQRVKEGAAARTVKQPVKLTTVTSTNLDTV